MNGLTARQSLDLHGLSPGQALAVTLARGSYGGYVVPLAKADGLTLIADAVPSDGQLVRILAPISWFAGVTMSPIGSGNIFLGVFMGWPMALS